MRISDWSSDVCSSDLASPAGLKMGFTSRAKMAQMKVKDPINGYLTEGGRLPAGDTVRRSDFILPRVEAEIAVVTSRPLRGPGRTVARVPASIDHEVGQA